MAPEEAEDFLLLLKRFANLLFTLLSDHCPFFKCTREMIRVYCAYSREAQKQLSQLSKGVILWIVILQSQQFALGEVNVLFGFTKMHKDLCAKTFCFRHSEILNEIVADPPSPSHDMGNGGSTPKRL